MATEIRLYYAYYRTAVPKGQSKINPRNDEKSNGLTRSPPAGLKHSEEISKDLSQITRQM